MIAATQDLETWRVLAVASCLVGAGTAGAAVAAWLLLMLADTGVATHLAGGFVAELQARARLRLRAVSVALGTAVALAVTALITGLIA
jgi:hypothetical protein